MAPLTAGRFPLTDRLLTSLLEVFAYRGLRSFRRVVRSTPLFIVRRNPSRGTLALLRKRLILLQLLFCFHINSRNQVRGHRTGSSHSGAEEYLREKTQTKGGTRIYHS